MRRAWIFEVLAVTLAVAFWISCGGSEVSPSKFSTAQLNGEYTNGPFGSVSPFIKVGLGLNGSTLSGFSDVVGNGPPCLKTEGYALSLKGAVNGSRLHWDVNTSSVPGSQAVYSFDGTAQVSGNQVQQITGTLAMDNCPPQSVVFSRD